MSDMDENGQPVTYKLTNRRSAESYYAREWSVWREGPTTPRGSATLQLWDGPFGYGDALEMARQRAAQEPGLRWAIVFVGDTLRGERLDGVDVKRVE